MWNVKCACWQTCQSIMICEQFIREGSMYSICSFHCFTRGRIRNQRFRYTWSFGCAQGDILLYEFSWLDTDFCQDRPAWLECSVWILMSRSARQGCKGFVCPGWFFGLDALIALLWYFQDPIHHPDYDHSIFAFLRSPCVGDLPMATLAILNRYWWNWFHFFVDTHRKITQGRHLSRT